MFKKIGGRRGGTRVRERRKDKHWETYTHVALDLMVSANIKNTGLI